jgi:hypothetical protein
MEYRIIFYVNSRLGNYFYLDYTTEISSEIFLDGSPRNLVILIMKPSLSNDQSRDAWQMGFEVLPCKESQVFLGMKTNRGPPSNDLPPNYQLHTL